MRIGSGTPSTYYLGSTAVAKIYLGATEVWAASVQITSVAMSAQNSTTGNVPVEITASADGTFNWILTSINPGVSPPSVAQVNAGNGQDGTAAEDSGSVTTTGGTGVLDALTTGLNESLWLVVADVDSVHFDATAEAIDTRVPSLSLPTAVSAGATSIDAGVTSSLAGGEIFFAARLATDPVLPKDDIENGTGNAVAIASDATPTADANNAATLTGLTTGTAYDIDSFQRRLGQESAVATSAAATPTASGLSILDVTEILNTTTETTTVNTTSAYTPAAGTNRIVLFVLLGQADAGLGGTTEADLNWQGVTPVVEFEDISTGTNGPVFQFAYVLEANLTSGTMTITTTDPPEQQAMICVAMTIGGVDQADPFGTQGTLQGSRGDQCSITPDAIGNLLIGAGVKISGGTSIDPSGWSLSSPSGATLEYSGETGETFNNDALGWIGSFIATGTSSVEFQQETASDMQGNFLPHAKAIQVNPA